MTIKMYLQHRNDIRRIRRDKKKGNYGFEYSGSNEKELQIIVNGPSLLKHKDKIDYNRDTMVVNGYIDTDLANILIPKWYVLTDPAYFNDENKVFLTKIEKYCVNHGVKVISQHSNRKRWNKKDFTDYYLYTILDRPIMKETVDKFELECLKANMMGPWFYNVLVMAIYAGIQMGYQTIYLLGADLNFMQQLSMDKGKLYSQDSHFYNLEGEKLFFEWGYLEELKHVEHALAGLKVMRQYADYIGVKIINTNPESYIEFFDFE